MKTLVPALQSHLDGELTSVATLVKITRVDGVVRGFTSHDHDLVVDSVVYKADGAFSPGSIEATTTLATGTVDITGMLSSAEIDEVDLRRGLYDQARIDIYLCNWSDLTQGTMQMRRGWLGEVTLKGGQYVAELRGLHDLLQRTIGATLTPECRHDLGDARCGVALAGLTVTGSVTAVVDAKAFLDSTRTEASSIFAYGKLLWTSGVNNGLAMEVRAWDLALHQFTLFLPMPSVISVGDSYSLTPGCDKRLATCLARFANSVNFGGFPHLPGLDRVMSYPDAT